MVHHLFADLVEAGILGQIRDVTVHLAVDFDVLHHVAAVGFEAAIEVVQVVNARDFACRGVEELGGNGLGEGVVAFLFVARHEVVALVNDHAVEGGNLVGRVLQVGVHGDNHVALGLVEAAIEGRTLAVVASELDAVHVPVLACEPLDDLPGAVGGAVVDEDNFVGVAVGGHHAPYPGVEFGQGLVLIVERHNNRYIHIDSV